MSSINFIREYAPVLVGMHSLEIDREELNELKEIDSFVIGDVTAKLYYLKAENKEYGIIESINCGADFPIQIGNIDCAVRVYEVYEDCAERSA